MITDPHTIQYWTQRMAGHAYDSPQHARNSVFRVCENHSQKSWFTPLGKNTIPENRRFANALPVYHDGDCWRVGQPLQEYLTMTSDNSDGTNGEPSGYPPSGGGVGSVAGLPDYKYYERLKSRREKLKALLKRRDPDGSSASPEDVQLKNELAQPEYLD